MEVILLERVEKLGQMGEVVRVKGGFARNFLLPQKKALRATEANRRLFDERRAQLEAANLERRGEAEQVASKLDGLAVVLVRQAGDAGQLYGSVKARDIADKVTQAGFTIDRRQVLLESPIKAIGLFPVRVALHPEVAVTVTANVARSEDEAQIQSQTGRAVIYQEEEEAAPEAAAPAEEAVETASEEPAEGEAAASEAPEKPE